MIKILVVDDEPDLRSHLEWAARGDKRQIMTAENGAKAIQLIREHDFDVIVTDLKMETELAGIEVLKAAKARDVFTQVIVITSFGTPEISVETMKLGAFDYLERNAPGTNASAMLRLKIALALEFREAKRGKEVHHE